MNPRTPLLHNGMGGMLIFRGRPAAFVGATRWYLVLWIEDRPPEDPDRRAVAVLCRTLVDDAARVMPNFGDEPSPN